MEHTVEIIKKAEANRAIIQRRLQKRIGDNLDYLMDKLFEVADGIWQQSKAPDGSILKVYKVPPDVKALTYLIDRVAGKPTLQVETSHQSQGIIQVQSILKSLSNGSDATPSSTDPQGDHQDDGSQDVSQ